MEWLFSNKAVQKDPQSVASYLRGERTLNRRRIGELLGETTVAFNMEVLDAYVASFNFAAINFGQALRRFLTTFHLPGEAQKIERIVEAFANQYHHCNAGVFANQVLCVDNCVCVFDASPLNSVSHHRTHPLY